MAKTLDDLDLTPPDQYQDLQTWLARNLGILKDVVSNAGSGLITGKYRFSDSVGVDPSSGQVRFDTGDYGTVTELFISDTTSSGGDGTNFLALLSLGDQVYFQTTADAAVFSVWKVRAAVTDEGDWFRIPVTLIGNGVFPVNNAKSTIALSYLSQSTGSGQWVLLEDKTPTAVTEIDFTWDETLYSSIRIELEGIQPAEDRNLMVQMGHSDGATILATAGDYESTYRGMQDIARTLSGTTTAIELDPGGLTVDATGTQGMSGKIDIIGGSDANTSVIIDALTHFVYGGAGGTMHSYHASGFIKPYARASEAFDTVRLIWSGSPLKNFKAQGSIRYYGLSNTI